MHGLLRAACFQALALQLPPPCPRRWEEANGEGGGGRSPGALRGRIATWEPLASHPSCWCPELGQWEQGPQEAERRGRGMLVILLSLWSSALRNSWTRR